MVFKDIGNRIKNHLSIFILFFIPVFADKVIDPQHQSDVPNPWFTGPLLAPTYSVIPPGHSNYEPYLSLTATTGAYNQHWGVVEAETLSSASLQPFIQIGLGYKMDIQISPIVNYNYCNHQVAWTFGDFPFVLDVQLFEPKPIGDWRPYVKLILTETFPTGKYRNLNPHKKGTDSSGKGSFITGVGVVSGKIIRLSKSHFLNLRFLLNGNIPAPTYLKGFNTYGGGYGTRARLFPGKTIDADLGLEINLSKNWSLACDFVGMWTTKTHFSGAPGTLADGSIAPLGSPASIQYSMAPALEYNWSDSLGIIAGGWFTVAGRNASRFWNAQIAFNYYR